MSEHRHEGIDQMLHEAYENLELKPLSAGFAKRTVGRSESERSSRSTRLTKLLSLLACLVGVWFPSVASYSGIGAGAVGLWFLVAVLAAPLVIMVVAGLAVAAPRFDRRRVTSDFSSSRSPASDRERLPR